MTVKEEVVEILKKVKELHGDWQGGNFWGLSGSCIRSSDGRCPLEVLTGTQEDYESEARKMGYSWEAIKGVLLAADYYWATYRLPAEKILINGPS